MRRSAWKYRSITDAITGLVFLAPALIILLTFNIYPIFYTAYLSLTDWNMMSPWKDFVGLQNYVELAQSSTFRLAFKNTIAFMLSQVIVALPATALANSVRESQPAADKFFRNR